MAKRRSLPYANFKSSRVEKKWLLRRCPWPNPQDFMWQKGVCRFDDVKGLGVGRLAWVSYPV